MNNELVNQQQALLNEKSIYRDDSTAFSSSSMPGWLQTIIDSSHLITFCISISVIIYGSFRSLNIDKENESYTMQQLNLQQNKNAKAKKKRRTKKLTLDGPTAVANSSVALNTAGLDKINGIYVLHGFNIEHTSQF